MDYVSEMIENHKCNGVGMRVYVAYKSRERCDEFPRGILMSTVYDEKVLVCTCTTPT
jgi:hypothetical protein